MIFTDHFSGHAANYADARPHYPEALFVWLASQCARHDLAWDAGCGNGQASVALTAHFSQVIASDPSAAQITQATAHPRVAYRVESAEAPHLPEHSVDLITVAQALHWLDLKRFYPAARRVLRPDGIIAVWAYGLTQVNAAIDRVFLQLYDEILGPYWPPERRHVETAYRELPFPLHELDSVPTFTMECHWTLAQYLAYLRTWSATQRYLREQQRDPVALLEAEFSHAWGDPQRTHRVRWPLGLRIGQR